MFYKSCTFVLTPVEIFFMNFFIIWIFCLAYVLCSEARELLNLFEQELNNYFYTNLSGFISERDDLSPLLDFPDSLISTLRSLERPVKLQYYVSDVTLHHFNQKLKEIKCKEGLEVKFLQTNILNFCCDFKSNYKLSASTSIKTRPIPESLLYPIEVDFIDYCGRNICLNSYAYDHKNGFNQPKWDIVFSILNDIKEKAYEFLIESMLRGCFHLYSDYILFLNLIRNSFERAASSVEFIYPVDGALLFLGQLSECYFGTRRQALSMLPNGNHLFDNFIRNFSYSIDKVLIEAVEEIERKFEGETEPKKINDDWKRIAERMFVCKELFIKSPYTLISNPASQTVDHIIEFCNNNQEKQEPFDLNYLKHAINNTIMRFLEIYESSILENKKLLTLYEYFKKLLNFVLDETVTLEKLHEFSYDFINLMSKFRPNLKSCEKIIDNFIGISKNLPELLLNSQLFNEDEIIYHQFINAIFLFSDAVQHSAGKLKFYRLSSDENCLKALRDIIDLKFGNINFQGDYMRLFKEFVGNIYEKELFSMFNDQGQQISDIESSSKASAVSAQESETNPVIEVKSSEAEVKISSESIDTDTLLDDPFSTIRNIYGLKASEKQELIDLVCGTYTNFLDQNFQGVNGNLKRLISKSIRETL